MRSLSSEEHFIKEEAQIFSLMRGLHLDSHCGHISEAIRCTKRKDRYVGEGAKLGKVAMSTSIVGNVPEVNRSQDLTVECGSQCRNHEALAAVSTSLEISPDSRVCIAPTKQEVSKNTMHQ